VADIREPNRKTIPSVDLMNPKSHKRLQNDRQSAAALGMTYKEWQAAMAALIIKGLNQEITMEEFEAEKKKLGR